MTGETSFLPAHIRESSPQDAESHRWIDSGDLAAAVRLAAGVGLLTLPTAWRERLVDHLARRKLRSVSKGYTGGLARMRTILPPEFAGGDFEHFLFRWNRHRLGYELLVLESSLGGPLRTRTEARGVDHIHKALARGRGVLLWAMPFLYAPLVPALATWREGVATVALSRWTHGYSTTRVGSGLLNRVRVRAENRFLRERVVIGRSQSPLVSLRRLLHELGNNRPVSILLASTADHLVATPFARGVLRLPVGPLRLARKADCPVLPVHCWREGDRFVVEIDAPLPPLEGGRDAATVAAELARRLEARVRRVPDQFHWMHPLLGPAEGDAEHRAHGLGSKSSKRKRRAAALLLASPMTTNDLSSGASRFLRPCIAPFSR